MASATCREVGSVGCGEAHVLELRGKQDILAALTEAGRDHEPLWEIATMKGDVLGLGPKA